MNAHTLNLDLKTNEKKIVLDLLKRYIPHVAVWAYGSRARWNARPDSDLDLVAFANDTDKRAIADLKEAFDESDLPFKVDLFVWAKVPEQFHTTIQKEHSVLQVGSIHESTETTDAPTVGADCIRPLDRIAPNPDPTHGTTNGTMQSSPTPATPDALPDGWTRTTLGEITTISSGKSRPKTKGDYPVYGGNGILDYADNFNFKDETIIVGRVGAYCGCVYFENKKFWLSDNALAIKAEDKNNMCFLYYLLIYEKLNQRAIGGAQPLLTQGVLNNLPLLLPPLSEQEAIAKVLGVLDDKIELNRRMNETLEGITEALFKSWFVDFDPVHRNIARGYPSVGADCIRPLDRIAPKTEHGCMQSNGTMPSSPTPDEAFTAFDHLFPDAFEDSPLGLIPSGWSVKPLDEIATFLNGLALQKFPPTGKDDMPVIKIAELRNGISSKSNLANSNVPKPYIIENGDVLFSWSGSLMLTIWTQGQGALNQHLFKVFSDKYPKWFYYSWVNYYLPWFQEIAESKATTMGHIQRQHLTQALVTLPDDVCLSVMNKNMQPILNHIIELQLQSQTLAELREALLPRLMSGRLRVLDPSVGGDCIAPKKQHGTMPSSPTINPNETVQTAPTRGEQ